MPTARAEPGSRRRSQPGRSRRAPRPAGPRRSSARRLAAAAARRSAEPPKRPLGLLAQQRIVAPAVDFGNATRSRITGIAERDEGVPAEVARIVARDEETVVALRKLGVVRLEPVDQRDVRLGNAARSGVTRTALLDAAVPRAYVLADVAA